MRVVITPGLLSPTNWFKPGEFLKIFRGAADILISTTLMFDHSFKLKITDCFYHTVGGQKFSAVSPY